MVDIGRRSLRAALTAIDGDSDGAAQAYAAILPELAELGLVPEQALVVLDMALVLGPDAPIVRESVDEARAILERLGARPFLERLDELMRRGGGTAHAGRVAAGATVAVRSSASA
jgi:hypothetical protein